MSLALPEVGDPVDNQKTVLYLQYSLRVRKALQVLFFLGWNTINDNRVSDSRIIKHNQWQ